MSAPTPTHTAVHQALELATELERDKWHVSAVTMQRAADLLREFAALGASQAPRAWEGPAGQLIPHEFYVPMAAAYPDKAVGYVPLYRATSKEQP